MTGRKDETVALNNGNIPRGNQPKLLLGLSDHREREMSTHAPPESDLELWEHIV